MKKTILLLGAFFLLIMQSCTINSDITLYKDSAATMLVDTEFKEMLDMLKSQAGGDPKSMEKLQKLPKEWITIYDMQLKEGDKIKDPDSIRLLKKMWIKGNFLINDLSGMSVKFDRFTKADFQKFQEMSDKNKDEKLPLTNDLFKNWDGRKLVLETDKFSMKELEKMMSGGENEGQPMDPEQAKAMMSMMMKKYVTNLRFESNIKSITGKHDWVKQIDSKTVQITYDVTNLDMSKPLTNKDKLVAITTE